MDNLNRLLDLFFSTPDSQDIDRAWTQVADYAQFLNESAPWPGHVTDASVLPHPKAELKLALLLCLGNTDDEMMREHLEAGYLMLSAFQDGVGGEPAGERFDNLDLEVSPEQIAATLERKYLHAAPWRRRAAEEMERLQKELEQLHRAVLDVASAF